MTYHVWKLPYNAGAPGSMCRFTISGSKNCPRYSNPAVSSLGAECPLTSRYLKPQESNYIDALIPWKGNFLEIVPRHHLCNARRFFFSLDFYGYFPYNLKALVVDLVDSHELGPGPNLGARGHGIWETDPVQTIIYGEF